VYGAATFENVDPCQIARCRIAVCAHVPQVLKNLIWIIRNCIPPDVACDQAMKRRVQRADEEAAAEFIGTT
jgi:hypothetical protein